MVRVRLMSLCGNRRNQCWLGAPSCSSHWPLFFRIGRKIQCYPFPSATPSRNERARRVLLLGALFQCSCCNAESVVKQGLWKINLGKFCYPLKLDKIRWVPCLCKLASHYFSFSQKGTPITRESGGRCRFYDATTRFLVGFTLDKRISCCEKIIKYSWSKSRIYS